MLGQASQGPAQFQPVMGKWLISTYELSDILSVISSLDTLVSLLQGVLFSKWLFSIFQTSYLFFHIYLIISLK